VVRRRPNKDVQRNRVGTQKDGKKKPRRPIMQGDVALPESYQKTGIVLMPVEPNLVYAYWDVALADLEQAKQSLSKEFNDAQAALRFHEQTDPAKTKKIQHNHFDVDIELATRSLFVPLSSSGKTYQVELGLRIADDRFFVLACSNIASNPSASDGGKSHERYIRVTDDSKIIEIPDASVSVGFFPGILKQPPQATRTDKPIVSKTVLPSRGKAPSVLKTELPNTVTLLGQEALVEPTANKQLEVLPSPPKASEASPDRVGNPGENSMGVKTDTNSSKHQSLRSLPVLHRKLRELAEFRRGQPLQVKQAPEAAQEDHVLHSSEHREFFPDLTAWCVDQLSFGTSSQRRSQKKG
jgi:hypothetical protein